jgi:hypothetical protein
VVDHPQQPRCRRKQVSGGHAVGAALEVGDDDPAHVEPIEDLARLRRTGQPVQALEVVEPSRISACDWPRWIR